ncbi:MAG: adenosine kinase [Candidatus Hadarchaeaceae archaeon]
MIKGASNFVSQEKLDKIQAKLADSIFARYPGDNARNTCEGIVYLGGKSAYAGRIASDTEGKIFEESLRKINMVSFLEKGPGRTGKIIALITRDGQRTFAVDLGNGNEYSGLPATGIKNSSFLYLTSITLFTDGAVSRRARDAMDVAEGNGVRISISLESPTLVEEKKDSLWRIVNRADVLFTNEEELKALTSSSNEKNAKELAEEINIVCLKKGEKGSSIFTKGEEFHIPAFPANVVDTTGAGDFYASGFLFGLSRGRSIKESGLLGAWLAKKVIEKFGATLVDDL